MGIQFFGEFLIERWVITRDQLLEAVELQEYRNSRFGDIAVEKGFLTLQQAKQVNERQRIEDLRFGDLAIKMGFMTKEQVRTILTMQKNNHLFLGESLLELGHVTEDILERELEFFEEEQRKMADSNVPVPDGVDGHEVVSACMDLTRKLFLRVGGMIIKLGEGRFITDSDNEDNRLSDLHVLVSVPIVSSVPVRYMLGVSSEVAVQLASNIIGQDATRESEALVEDAVREFCNMVCGNVAARLAKKGLEVDIGPPESLEKMPEDDEVRGVVQYPVRVASGIVDVRFLVLHSTGTQAAG